MAIETSLLKRPALYKGEVGLFPTSEMASDDVALFAMNEEVMAKLRSERKIKALNFLWGLVYKSYQNTDYWLTKEKAMEWFKARARFTQIGIDPDSKKLVERLGSLTRINDEELRLLTARVEDIICAEILPGVKRKELRREIEEMMKDRR